MPQRTNRKKKKKKKKKKQYFNIVCQYIFLKHVNYTLILDCTDLLKFILLKQIKDLSGYHEAKVTSVFETNHDRLFKQQKRCLLNRLLKLSGNLENIFCFPFKMIIIFFLYIYFYFK